MTTPIGTAESGPATPTSGAAIAPIMNWMTPSSADAVPATVAWSASASAVVLGSTNGRLETIANIGTSSAHTGRPPIEDDRQQRASRSPPRRRARRAGGASARTARRSAR